MAMCNFVHTLYMLYGGIVLLLTGKDLNYIEKADWYCNVSFASSLVNWIGLIYMSSNTAQTMSH